MRKSVLLSLAAVSLSVTTLVAVSGCKKDTSMKDDSMKMASPSASTTMYTCSMHPEVVTDAPGKCPKCGMNLVVKK